jgi:hypothetical protein
MAYWIAMATIAARGPLLATKSLLIVGLMATAGMLMKMAFRL